MDSREQQVYSEGPAATGSLGSTVPKNEGYMGNDETVDILKQTAASLHSFNAPNTFSMVHSSNNPTTQEEVDAILKTHFYPLNLSSTQSVVAFLLLTCFFLKNHTREAESLKKLYEDHISLLKEKNAELESKLLRETSSGSGKSSPDYSMSPTTTTTQDCSNCEQLRERVETLSCEVSQLQRSYDEVCHVNGQWAQDYEALSKQIRNATGFHSVSSGSSSARSTSLQFSTTTNSASSSSSHSCVRCSIYESQLDDRAQEVEGLRAQVVGLREDIKDCKERLNQKQQEMSCLENEYQILRIQVQEIGDLQLALNMKQEYRKMQRNLQQKNKMYQDAMCEKLDLQKQVEKLRQAFLKCFPIPAPLQAQPPVSMGTRPPASGSYYSFPLHSCRNNLQSNSIDSNPPTPPGLLARGDMRGDIVEKDDQMVPRIKLDRDFPARTSSRQAYGLQSRSLEHLDVIHDHAPRGRSITDVGKGPLNGSSLSLSPGALRVSDLALNSAMDSSSRHSETLASANTSSDFTSQSHSRNPYSGASMNLVPNGSMGSSVSSHSSGSAIIHSNTAVHYTNSPASLSSLGYGSNDSSSLDSHSVSFAHRHAPYSPRVRNTGSSAPSEMELGPHHEIPEHKPSKSNLGRSSSFTTRPSSLTLGPKTGGPTANVASKAQFFYCPNCKKSFSCAGKDSFDSWFDHVKSCSA